MNAHTKGKLGIHPDGRLSGDGLAIVALEHPKQVTVAWTAAVRAGLPEKERLEAAEAMANARELAHRWNAHDDLLAAARIADRILCGGEGCSFCAAIARAEGRS